MSKSQWSCLGCVVLIATAVVIFLTTRRRESDAPVDLHQGANEEETRAADSTLASSQNEKPGPTERTVQEKPDSPQKSARPERRAREPETLGDQHWPQIREGRYVRWGARAWNTRKRDRIWADGDIGSLGQRNGTATYLGEDKTDGGTVELDVKFDAGYLVPAGGGKHFMEIMSWVADRSDRQAVNARPWSRIELANLGDRPRCLVWNYGSHFRGRATKIFTIGPPFQPDRWYRIQFEWSYRAPKGHVTIHVDDRSYESDFEFVPGTIGPGRFYLFGHVETRQPDGCLHFRNFRLR